MTAERENVPDFLLATTLDGQLLQEASEQKLREDIDTRLRGQQGYEMVFEAMRVATLAHQDQRRREEKPYIVHPLRVAIRLMQYYQATTGALPSATDLSIALLHDVVEDTDVLTIGEIGRKFNTDVANGVAELTNHIKATGEFTHGTREAYFENLQNCSDSVQVIKVLDRIDNLESLSYIDVHKRRKKLVQTRRYICPLVEGKPEILGIGLSVALKNAVRIGRRAR